MAEKFADLAHTIQSAMNKDSVYPSAKYALEWLDEHPGQVPGRTITESELWDAYRLHSDDDQIDRYRGFLGQLGITVVPDPEPTIEEKMDADLVDWFSKNDDARPSLTEHLIERGWVKAPGGDNGAV